MRLTLRTLLAYLDDTLEPAQAKIIGQKVAESEQARELMDHIKQVTRRRRITTPPTNGPNGKIDPNTIAEYLDGAVSAEQAGEVEQVCLASDAHLAEIAACHQILALVLGEPALVPPTAKSRMYSLVKGPESIPFRKPTNVLPSGEEDHPYTGDEIDEPLRMGLPFVGGMSKWTNLILLIGSGIGASVLLFFAIWHVLNLPGGNDDGNGGLVAVLPENEPTKEPPPQSAKAVVPQTKQKDNKDKKGEVKIDLPKDIKVKEKPIKVDDKWPEIPPPNIPPPVVTPRVKDGEGDAMPANRIAAADDRLRKLGVYEMPSPRDPGIVVRRQIGKPKSAWARLWGDKVDVESGCTYVAPQGFRGDLLLEQKLQLTLVGMMPVIMRVPYPLNESMVDLHSHDSYIDLTLQRGRIVLTSLRDAPVAVRIRFENPGAPQHPEFADLLLQGNGTQIFVDRVAGPPMEGFVKNPESDKRVPPGATIFFCVAKGNVTVRLKDTYHLTAPPGTAALVWNSISENGKNVFEQEPLKELPEFVTLTPPAPSKELKKISDDFLKARQDLSTELGTKAIDVRLAESLTTKDPVRRILVVLTYAGLDMLDELIEILKNDRHADLGDTVVQCLRNSLTNSRDSEYVLYDRIKELLPPEKTADKIMELLHGISDPELLIDYLDNPSPVMRRIANLDLMRLNIPMAQTIKYDPLMPDAARMAAQMQWRALLTKLKKEAEKMKK